jgi:hypothetical protein
MGWFRWRKRVGAWLALLALALQLGLAFGHIHPETIHPQATSYSAEIAAAAPAEPDGDHGDTDKNCCPSCAILSLLAGAQLGAPPVSAIPVRLAAEAITPAIETGWSGQTRTAFRSRAPPLS